MADDSAGTVYLLHLDPPFRHARHYTGWTSNLDERLEAHRAGRGARLMEVVWEAGGSFRLARTWPGSRALERAIKDLRNAPRLCPVCTPSPWPLTRVLTAAARPRGEAVPETEADPAPEPGQWPGVPPLLPPVRLATPGEIRDLMPVIDRLADGWLAERHADAAEPELELLPARPANPFYPFPTSKEHTHMSKHSDNLASIWADIAAADAEADMPVGYSLTPEAEAALDDLEAEADIG